MPFLTLPHGFSCCIIRFQFTYPEDASLCCQVVVICRGLSYPSPFFWTAWTGSAANISIGCRKTMSPFALPFDKSANVVWEILGNKLIASISPCRDIIFNGGMFCATNVAAMAGGDTGVTRQPNMSDLALPLCFRSTCGRQALSKPAYIPSQAYLVII